jgi:hypothetical protein
VIQPVGLWAGDSDAYGLYQRQEASTVANVTGLYAFASSASIMDSDDMCTLPVLYHMQVLVGKLQCRKFLNMQGCVYTDSIRDIQRNVSTHS